VEKRGWRERGERERERKEKKKEEREIERIGVREGERNMENGFLECSRDKK